MPKSIRNADLSRVEPSGAMDCIERSNPSNTPANLTQILFTSVNTIKGLNKGFQGIRVKIHYIKRKETELIKKPGRRM